MKQVDANLLVIVDETGSNLGLTPLYAWAPRGKRAYGSVPRMTEAYLKSRPNVISSMTVGLIDREVGVFVLDKGYFRTADSIKAAPNIALLAAKPVTMADGDKLIELRTVFLLMRK